MKKLVCVILALILALSLTVCYAESEHSTDDYSWLDDLTINQLRELDNEIHKRIPGDEAETSDTNEDSILIGEWDYVEAILSIVKESLEKIIPMIGILE